VLVVESRRMRASPPSCIRIMQQHHQSPHYMLSNRRLRSPCVGGGVEAHEGLLVVQQQDRVATTPEPSLYAQQPQQLQAAFTMCLSLQPRHVSATSSKS
jgi:hypothetical protein